MRKEAERGEEIKDGIEPAAPARRHPSHVATGVAEPGAGAPLSCNREQFAGVVEAVDVVSSFGQQVGVPSLSARDVENAGAHGKLEQINEARRFLAIALGREKQAVLQEIVGVEG